MQKNRKHPDRSTNPMEKGPPEDWCWQALRDLRWPVRVLCPYCRGRAGRHWRKGHGCQYWCSRCKRKFSDLTGTPFEGTHLPLKLWFQAIVFLAIKGQPTAKGLVGTLGVDRKTARRIRDTLRNLRHDPFIRSIGASALCRMTAILKPPTKSPRGGDGGGLGHHVPSPNKVLPGGI